MELVTCLFLFLKYGYHVLGINRSRNAIEVCKNNLKDLLANKNISEDFNKIYFIYLKNNGLADLKSIKVVYMVDVIEYLHYDEIAQVLGKIKKWSKEEGALIALHVDNDYYLKGARPLPDALSVLSGK